MLDTRSITDWAVLRGSFRWSLPATFNIADELRLLAREHLARFAYPRRVVFEELPRNTSGKVDRAATKERIAEGG